MLITDIQHQIAKQQDDAIYEAVVSTGINVDKYELLKALRYDRNQYEKGYADGVREFAERIFEAFPSDMNYTTISRFLVKTILNGMVGADNG